jgi:hypothetical protein
MTRRVVSSDQVFHLWAHQAQESARNGTGSVYFRGNTCYSYRNSWPLARIYTHKTRGQLVLTNSERHSITTSYHQGRANRAASHLPRIAVPLSLSQLVSPQSYPQREIDDVVLKNLHGEIATFLATALRSLHVSTVEWRLANARELYSDIQRYREFFGVRSKLAPFDQVLWGAALERVQRIESPDPIRDAKRFKAREQRKISEQRKLQDIFNKHCAAATAYNAQNPSQLWRDTGNFPASPAAIHWKLKRKLAAAGFEIEPRPYHDNQSCLLRVNGNEIETSQGARIPLDHAPRLWTLIQAVRASGQPYKRNGHTEHAGQFAIDRVEVDGTLKAGCHQIAYDEIERMARHLNLA